MHVLIDESVILRYLFDDDSRLSKEASAVIATGEAFTYPEIMARVAVTLRDAYRVPRTQISITLQKLLEDITVADEAAVRYACRLFGDTMLDFTDCMMVARSTLYGERLVSFDKPMMKRVLST